MSPPLARSFLGGQRNDDGERIVIGTGGSVYIAGYTDSRDFPTTPGAFDTSYNGGTTLGDAFVARVPPDGKRLGFSTYLGGTSDDKATGLAADEEGAMYVSPGNGRSSHSCVPILSHLYTLAMSIFTTK